MSKDQAKDTVYVPMCADVVHPGHLNILKEGAKHGSVVVGLLSDAAVATKKRVPLMNYDQRYEVVSSIRWVDSVIPQETPDYRPNLRKLKPRYVIHGDDWSEKARESVTETIAEWGGTLIEIPYTEGISSTQIQEKRKRMGVTTEERQKSLARYFQAKKMIRALEAHDGLSALIVENCSFTNEQGVTSQYDAVWVSSLTDSLAKGKPDSEVVDKSSRLATIHEILGVTTKPLIVDGDTGGQVSHFKDFVRSLERIGVSAVVIEDKTGYKRNSLHHNTEDHTLEDPHTFAAKIKAGKACILKKDFMIIARIESLVAGSSVSDALARAQLYIEAGADAIMIHSKLSDATDIKQFMSEYNNARNRVPVLLVPTSYDTYSEDELSAWGADIVVYANQLIRSAYPAMQHAAVSILKNKRSIELRKSMAAVSDMLQLVEDTEHL